MLKWTETQTQRDRQTTHKSIGYGEGDASITGRNLRMVAEVSRRVAGTQS